MCKMITFLPLIVLAMATSVPVQGLKDRVIGKRELTIVDSKLIGIKAFITVTEDGELTGNIVVDVAGVTPEADEKLRQIVGKSIRTIQADVTGILSEVPDGNMHVSILFTRIVIDGVEITTLASQVKAGGDFFPVRGTTVREPVSITGDIDGEIAYKFLLE